MKHHKLGGLHNKHFSYFWRQEVQDQGPNKYSVWEGLSSWFPDGCFLTNIVEEKKRLALFLFW